MNLLRRRKHNEQGNMILITAIVLLILSIIVASCLSISRRQYNIATLDKNTSNTYILAKSAAEKQIDTINKAIQSDITSIANAVGQDYIDRVSQINLATPENKANVASLSARAAGNCYDYLEYNMTNDKLQATNADFRGKMQTAICDYIKDHFVTGAGVGAINNDVVYKVQSDRDQTENVTTITIKTLEGASPDQMTVDVTAVTRDSGGKIYDQQHIEAQMAIVVPDNINQIIDRYTWAINPSELLKGPIVCFSDLALNTDSELQVTGDVFVKGRLKSPDITSITTYDEDGSEHVGVADSTFPEADEHGGVIANNGAKISINGNLYCDSNVLVSDGWTLGGVRNHGSKITVDKDIIANTVGIVDDFYTGGDNQAPFGANGKVTGANITVNGNVMVDNDVMVDEWVEASPIDIAGVIWGVSDGSDVARPITVNGTTVNVIDPNTSSGVFSQGKLGSEITANKGIYVAGQPFIKIGNHMPLRLFESIGAPYKGVSDCVGYKDNDSLRVNSDYINSEGHKSFILKQQVIAPKVYVPEHCFASLLLNGSAGSFDVGVQEVLGGGEANRFFRTGGSLRTFDDFFTAGANPYDANEQNLLSTSNLMNYYRGSTVLVGNTNFTGKILEGAALTGHYLGLQGYMAAKRSVFYKKVEESGPTRLAFSDALGSLPGKAKWSYKNPIAVYTQDSDDNGVDCGEETTTITDHEIRVDISKLYVSENDGASLVPWPTIIINNSDKVLTLEASNSARSVFNGIIISRGQLQINDDLKVKGSLIIGGPEAALNRKDVMTGKNSCISIVSGKRLEVEGDNEMLFKVIAQNRTLYRQVLDALRLTNFARANTSVSEGRDIAALESVYGPLVTINPAVEPTYTVGKVFLSDQSYMDIDTKDVHVEISKIYKKD